MSRLGALCCVCLTLPGACVGPVVGGGVGAGVACVVGAGVVATVTAGDGCALGACAVVGGNHRKQTNTRAHALNQTLLLTVLIEPNMVLRDAPL